MHSRRAALGSLLFLVVAPGTVAGLLPWWLSGWQLADPFPWSLPVRMDLPVRIAGGLLIVAGAAFLLQAFVRFVTEGRGTPAPPAPTQRLVVGGAYRYLRNPMYVAVVATILGQALLLGQSVLLWYALGIAAVQAAFVRFYEEPALRRRYGEEYERYRREVPAWWPRWRPWRPDLPLPPARS